MIKRMLGLWIVGVLLTACASGPEPTVEMPTLLVLPSTTPTWTATPTFTPTATATPTPTAPGTPTPTPTDPPTGTPSITLTPSFTLTLTPSLTFTPSLTITDTITPSPTITPSLTPDQGELGLLALALQSVTVAPFEVIANTATQTRFAELAQTIIVATQVAVTNPAFVAPPAGGVPTTGGVAPTASPTPSGCPVLPPPALASFLPTDPALQAQIGCPVGGTISVTAASQQFQGGAMVFVAGPPDAIYVLFSDGSFRRFDDTFTPGVDPESGGETPPAANLIEPVRGFGKVWRENPDVRARLGWGTSPESGAPASLLRFDRGRAIFLPQRNETIVLADDAGGFGGRWRAFTGGF
ncbi:MAG: hypothetical protein GYB67_18955 [Chloroflexi bacterium]|nr:hypothetical protein [Chloroflexota bacterium]